MESYRTSEAMDVNTTIFSNSTVTCNNMNWDKLLESETLTGAQFIQYLLWTNQSSCGLTYDFGGVMLDDPIGYDGQKAICMDLKVKPRSTQCLVYSFGIKNEWSFDEQMELYGCQVYAFDPSMNMKPHDYGPAIHFYDWGLSHRNKIGVGKQSGWNMRTLSSIYNDLSKLHGNSTVIDYLKIDIENGEWKVIEDIIKSGMLSKIRQLGIEIHLTNNESIKVYRKHAKLLRLLEKSGMMRFNSKYNQWCTGEFPELKLRASLCYEIAWYNSKLQHRLSNVKPGYLDFLIV